MLAEAALASAQRRALGAAPGGKRPSRRERVDSILARETNTRVLREEAAGLRRAAARAIWTAEKDEAAALAARLDARAAEIEKAQGGPSPFVLPPGVRPLRGLGDTAWWRSPWVWAGAGALLLLGGAGAVGVTVGFPRAFAIVRRQYRTVEEWATDRGQQIRAAFRIALDRLRPFGTVKPQDLSADAWNEQKIRTLHPSVQGRFRAFVQDAQAIARSHGDELMIWDAARPLERQVETVRRGASQTISSRHLFGLALDLVMRGRSDLWDYPRWYRQEVVPMGKERHGLFWGGDWRNFPDTPHWEIPPDEWPAVARVAMDALRADFPGVA